MSNFTRKNLDDLADSSASYLSPLSVIAHIDLDAFYAQCEQVRLGLPPDAPVVCRQWNALIAVGYGARKYGISRMMSYQDAVKACPDLVAPHVATFKKGETTWKYHENPDVDNYKVSLDPFRRQSRKIFRIFKSQCPTLEKAGIDETFFDLGQVVRQRALELFPELQDIEANEKLPPVPDKLPDSIKWMGTLFDSTPDTAAPTESTESTPELPEELQWKDSILTADEEDADESAKPESQPPLVGPRPKDWDDMMILLGSMIAWEIRQKVHEELNYTCSAGVARNKILAKLASPRNKPNGQTVVLNARAIDFLKTCEFTDIWGLGGKLGDQVVEVLNLPPKNSIGHILDIPLLQLQRKLGQKVGIRVFNLARGKEPGEVVMRVNIKSMLSVKQFTSHPLKTRTDAHEWLKVFTSDIAGRLVELDEETGTPYRPKTVALQLRQFRPKLISRQKQSQFSKVSQTSTFADTQQQLFEASCSLLQMMQAEAGESLFPCAALSCSISGIIPVVDSSSSTIDEYFNKRRKTDTGAEEVAEEAEDSLFVSEKISCARCRKRIDQEQIDEHMDWHFAKDLQDRENGTKSKSASTSPVKPKASSSKKAAPTKKKTVTNNASVLSFFQPKKRTGA